MIKTKALINNVIDFAITFAITMTAALALTTFVIKPVCIKGSSMFPTLTPDSLGFSSIIDRKTKGIERFDIVIIKQDEAEKMIVKRVIGLPGETIEYRNGDLYINGKHVDETFMDKGYAELNGKAFKIDVAPITLKQNEYYCLGDNRGVSRDSRVFGPVTDDQIIAKNVFTIWSPGN